MSKYSYQFKLKIVLEYLNGTLGYTLLAKKYSIPSPSIIKTWVNQYQINGKEELQVLIVELFDSCYIHKNEKTAGNIEVYSISSCFFEYFVPALFIYGVKAVVRSYNPIFN